MFSKSEKALYAHAVAWYLDRMNMHDVKIKVEEEWEPFFYGRMAMKNKRKGWLLLSPHIGCAYKTLQTVFHELTHAHQYYRGDLEEQNWKGEDFSDVDYEFLPWEIEASGVEQHLTDLYLEEQWS